MKKLILVLAIALMASPTFALTVYLQREGTSNIVDVNYSDACSTNLPRAFALDVTIDSPGQISNVINYKTGESCAVSKGGTLGFGIYPAKIDINTAGIVRDWGTPLADTADPGASGSALNTGHVILEFASLYFNDANKPEISGRLCQLTITPGTTTANLNVRAFAETTYRGGVVLENGNQFPTDVNTLYRKPAVTETITTPTITKTTAAPAVAGRVNAVRSETFVASGAASSLGHTPLEYQFTWGDGTTPVWVAAATQTHTFTTATTSAWSANVTVQARCQADPGVLSNVSAAITETGEAIKSTATIYADWVLAQWNRPICWAYQRQCHADINGAGVGSGGTKKWVTNTDLTAFKAAYNIANSALPTDGICSDLNHAGVPAAYSSTQKRVTNTDLTTFKNYYNKPENDPTFPNTVCPNADYNFWTN